MRDESVDDDVFRRLCDELSRLGGMVASSGRAGMREHDHASKSSVTDLVTVCDENTERALRQRLAEVRPDDGVVGEEGGTSAGTSGYEWIIDPIDGTTNFVFGLPCWGCSVAVAINDEVIAGAIYLPDLDELFSAGRRCGATRNGEAIIMPDHAALATSLIATWFSYQSEIRAIQGARVAHLLPQVRDIRRSGSAAYDLCAVASGRVTAYYEDGISRWDIAAGALIALEAGATISTMPGAVHGPESIVAAAPGVFDALCSCIAREV